MLEIRSSRPLTGLTQTLYICILIAAIAEATQNQLHKRKKRRQKDIYLSAIFFNRKKVDWVVNDWVYSSSTFIDQERDCRYGI